MQAEDREQLRDAVATHVMGWTASRIPWAYSDEADLWHDAQGTPLVPRHAWRPDEDDRQLMEVVDRMIALGYACELTIGDRGTRACFARADGERTEEREDADRRMAVLGASLAALA